MINDFYGGIKAGTYPFYRRQSGHTSINVNAFKQKGAQKGLVRNQVANQITGLLKIQFAHI